CFLMLPPPPRSPLFPYTTLFRTQETLLRAVELQRRARLDPSSGSLPALLRFRERDDPVELPFPHLVEQFLDRAQGLALRAVIPLGSPASLHDQARFAKNLQVAG